MDLNVQAFRLVQQATEESPVAAVSKRKSSRKGGIAGGRARAQAMTPERRVEIARKASAARWGKVSPAV